MNPYMQVVVISLITFTSIALVAEIYENKHCFQPNHIECK